MKEQYEYTDRYEALHMAPPNLATLCKGHCEGVGYIPVYVREGDVNAFLAGTPMSRVQPKETESDPVLRLRWNVAHEDAGRHTCDGWHFVKCPECNGTGKRPAPKGGN